MTKTNDMKEQQWLCPVRPEEIPKEFVWVAQDMDGNWCAYQQKPTPNVQPKSWLDYGCAFFESNKYLCKTHHNVNWLTTLQKIPRCN